MMVRYVCPNCLRTFIDQLKKEKIFCWKCGQTLESKPSNGDNRGQDMNGKTLIHIQRNGKDICFLLKEGETLSLENIVDVFVSDQPERLNPEASKEDAIV